MDIESSTTIKHVFSGVPNLDPIALYIENYGKGAGKVVITCFDESWTHFWSHMGEGHTIESFMKTCSDQYLVGKFMRGRNDTECDVEATVKAAKALLLKERRARERDKGRTLDLWAALEHVDEVPTSLHHEQVDMWIDIFGDEFWCGFVNKPTDAYLYLTRVVQTVKEGLAQLAKEAENGNDTKD